MQAKAKPTPAVAPTASGIAHVSPDVSPEAIAALVAQGAAALHLPDAICPNKTSPAGVRIAHQ